MKSFSFQIEELAQPKTGMAMILTTIAAKACSYGSKLVLTSVSATVEPLDPYQEHDLALLLKALCPTIIDCCSMVTIVTMCYHGYNTI